MSGALLADRTEARALGAFVAAAAFDVRGEQAAFALADGTVHIAPAGGESAWRAVAAHRGSALCLAAHPTGGFVSGGDDGMLLHVALDGATATLLTGRKWVEQVASAQDGKTAIIAAAAGRVVHLLDAKGRTLRECEHPSTVTGIAFDARGKRFAAAHYNGASLWFTGSSAAARVLNWKGSHIAVAMHPEAQAVVTAMQENALHGWRLADGHDMRMSGYPAKTESLAFTRGGRWLASSGADQIVLWPFFGGGPIGKPPNEIAPVEGVLVTRVAPHPKQDMVAAGYANGMVVLADIASGRVLPLRQGGAAITALCWNAAGGRLAVGGEDGAAAVLDLTKK